MTGEEASEVYLLGIRWIGMGAGVCVNCEVEERCVSGLEVCGLHGTIRSNRGKYEWDPWCPRKVPSSISFFTKAD